MYVLSIMEYVLSMNEYVLSMNEYELSKNGCVLSINEHVLSINGYLLSINANARYNDCQYEKKGITLPDLCLEVEIKSSSPSSVSS